MTTSQTSFLSKPTGDQRVANGTFAYFRTRNKHRVYTLVMQELKRSQITRAQLARRMGKTPDQISRWLAAPGNWELDTVSDFLFAISAAEPIYHLSYPLDAAASNSSRSVDWLDDEEALAKVAKQAASPSPPPPPKAALDAPSDAPSAAKSEEVKEQEKSRQLARAA